MTSPIEHRNTTASKASSGLLLTLSVGAALLSTGLLWPMPGHGQDGFLDHFARDRFRQLDELLPTPNDQRIASGAPGPKYWQQRADYDIDVEIDDKTQRIIGRETIHYHNHSPHTLRYVWLQLDQNIFQPGSDAAQIRTAPGLNRVPFNDLKRELMRRGWDGGFKITAVNDARGRALKHSIVKTMMRVDLPRPLKPRKSLKFSVDWNYNINDCRILWGRSGYEYFKKDGNYLYEMAQWFPRMVAYTDVDGWQHKQFLGRGEFTLEFGDYTVRITVPSDHVVSATGVLKNPGKVLTKVQRQRLKQARSAKTPMFVITPEEAKANEKSRAKDKKTWVFEAKNVRDFAFASSRKFIWDAQGHKVGAREVMAMSFYPNEGEPLWSRYSTHAIIHTLDVYSRYTFEYPYPTAISVNGPVGGMEYPMICFNGPRPEKDGTYSKRTKYGLISVIIHEVGHNYFPMIVNSDERQWTWMDEGLNTFLQYLTEQEWEDNYPSRRGEAQNIVGYMRSQNQVPIMTNSESILQFGNNAYAKPATALNILRESILGRELFDFAFKEYARRWKFKRPQPADFFRTMEDASGVDLDWFWRGWFYSTKPVDINLSQVRYYHRETGDPEVDKKQRKDERESRPETLSEKRNKGLTRRANVFPELKDFYNSYDELNITDADREAFERYKKGLNKEQKALLEQPLYFYVLDFKNEGGLVMPLIIKVEYEGGGHKIVRVPAEIWRRNAKAVNKLIITDKPAKSFTLDPFLETADINTDNNHFPRKMQKSRFQLFKQKNRWGRGNNPMKAARKAAKKRAEKAKKKGRQLH